MFSSEACEIRHALSLRRWIVADNLAERALANRVLRKSRTPKKAWLQPFRGDDAGDAGEVVGDADVGPGLRIKERLHGGKTSLAQLQNENSAGLQVLRCLSDESGVNLVAFFATIEGHFWFVIADFA